MIAFSARDIRCVLDPKNRRLVRNDGKWFTLPAKEFALLNHLIDNNNRIVTSESLLDTVWRDVSVLPESVAKAVSEIRKKIGDTAPEKLFIETVHTVGYKFIANISDYGTAASDFGPSLVVEPGEEPEAPDMSASTHSTSDKKSPEVNRIRLYALEKAKRAGWKRPEAYFSDADVVKETGLPLQTVNLGLRTLGDDGDLVCVNWKGEPAWTAASPKQNNSLTNAYRLVGQRAAYTYLGRTGRVDVDTTSEARAHALNAIKKQWPNHSASPSVIDAIIDQALSMAVDELRRSSRQIVFAEQETIALDEVVRWRIEPRRP